VASTLLDSGEGMLMPMSTATWGTVTSLRGYRVEGPNESSSADELSTHDGSREGIYENTLLLQERKSVLARHGSSPLRFCGTPHMLDKDVNDDDDDMYCRPSLIWSRGRTVDVIDNRASGRTATHPGVVDSSNSVSDVADNSASDVADSSDSASDVVVGSSNSASDVVVGSSNSASDVVVGSNSASDGVGNSKEDEELPNADLSSRQHCAGAQHTPLTSTRTSTESSVTSRTSVDLEAIILMRSDYADMERDVELALSESIHEVFRLPTKTLSRPASANTQLAMRGTSSEVKTLQRTVYRDEDALGRRAPVSEEEEEEEDDNDNNNDHDDDDDNDHNDDDDEHDCIVDGGGVHLDDSSAFSVDGTPGALSFASGNVSTVAV